MRVAMLFLVPGLLAPAVTGADDPPKEAVFTGRLEATVVELRPRVTGSLTKVYVREGEVVKAGDVLAEIDPRVFKIEEAAARAKVERSTARAKLTEVQLNRAKRAAVLGAIPNEELAQVENDRAVAEAEVVAAKAELELAELNLSWTKITAPIDGVVASLNATAGNLARADTSVLGTLLRTDPLRVAFDVPEGDVTKLQAALKDGKLAVAVGLAGEEGFPHPVVVDSIAPVVDPATGTVRFKATLANPKGEYRSGAFARVRLTPLK